MIELGQAGCRKAGRNQGWQEPGDQSQTWSLRPEASGKSPERNQGQAEEQGREKADGQTRLAVPVRSRGVSPMEPVLS